MSWTGSRSEPTPKCRVISDFNYGARISFNDNLGVLLMTSLCVSNGPMARAEVEIAAKLVRKHCYICSAKTPGMAEAFPWPASLARQFCCSHLTIRRVLERCLQTYHLKGRRSPRTSRAARPAYTVDQDRCIRISHLLEVIPCTRLKSCDCYCQVSRTPREFCLSPSL